jgi:hypothetical protein
MPRPTLSLMLALMQALASSLGAVCGSLERWPEKRQGDSAEVASSSAAAYDDVGLFAGHRHLLLRFEAYDGLVQQDVVEHAT